MAYAYLKSLLRELKVLRPQMAQAAQVIYDEWDGDDEEGGICDEIASALASVIASNLDCNIREGGWDGDDHSNIIVSRGREAYWVDIDYDIYETGGGYAWKKIPDIVFAPEDIMIDETGTEEDFTVEESLEAPLDNDEFGTYRFKIYLEMNDKLTDFACDRSTKAALDTIRRLAAIGNYLDGEDYKLTLFIDQKPEHTLEGRSVNTLINALYSYIQSTDDEITESTKQNMLMLKLWHAKNDPQIIDDSLEECVFDRIIVEGLESFDDEDKFGHRYDILPMTKLEKTTAISLVKEVVSLQDEFLRRPPAIVRGQHPDTFTWSEYFFNHCESWRRYIRLIQELCDRADSFRHHHDWLECDDRLWG